MVVFISVTSISNESPCAQNVTRMKTISSGHSVKFNKHASLWRRVLCRSDATGRTWYTNRKFSQVHISLKSILLLWTTIFTMDRYFL